ncbi:MAG: V-type ATP synthase subunit F [Clostridia bacterium]|nr:V-type ATP synthase subunit F [Clostridia bacterium]
MYKIGAMGDRDSIYGFAALGMSVFPTEDADEAKALIRRLADNEYGIIYITEALAALIPEEIERYRFVSTPAIILVPGVTGNTGAGMADLEKSVKKAVGSNILK